jgi:3-deoxy-D-manno-octulosonic-acid transferase
MLMRALYTLLWILVLPWLPLRLWWRGRREPAYRERIGERFGRYGDLGVRRGTYVIWIHAVSLGETRAAAPLVARIARDLPAATILLTHMTATGREAGRALYGSGVVQAWLPYDFPFAVRAFLAHFAPRAGLLMETELWPNLAAACAVARVPLFLVNARLSERSFTGYRRFAVLTQPMFASLAGVAAQTADDAARVEAAGATNVVVTGNLKFDVEISAGVRADGDAMRGRFGAARPVFLAAQTRDGEEALILDAIARGALPEGTLTVIVPRHPQRFDEVGALLAARTRRCLRTSPSFSAIRWGNCRPTTAPPTSRSSGEACCPSAARISSSPSPWARRRSSVRTRSTLPRPPPMRSRPRPRCASRMPTRSSPKPGACCATRRAARG